MSRLPFAALSAIAFAALAHGQVTLDWSASTWSDGTSTGTYNSLRGATGATAAITPLTYDFGNGLTALVSATRVTPGVQWQAGAVYYGGYAPTYYSTGDVFALGLKGAATDVVELSIVFSKAVLLNSLTIGDLDRNNKVRDELTITSSWAAMPVGLQLLGASAARPPVFTPGLGTSTLTGITQAEPDFSSSAPTAWATIGSSGQRVRNLTFSLSTVIGSNPGDHGIWFGDLEVEAIVPEPSTYGLFGAAALIALVGYRRSRKA